MANPNPYQARLARALKRKPGAIDAVRQRTWGVLCLAYEEIGTAADDEARRKAILAFSQVAALYMTVWEASELEARLAALEALITPPRTQGARSCRPRMVTDSRS